MLKKALFTNFQIHKRKLITFSKTVTTIIGPTDRGKSALLRGLAWLFFNQPSGTEFIRDDSNSASVKALIDGHTIERQRSKSKNIYKLDGETFKSFGTGGVPDPIEDLLKVNQDNYQTQIDPYFWLSLSPPQLSRELNQIVDLSLVDRTLSYLASKVRSKKAEKGIISDRLKEAKQKVEETKYVLDLKKDLDYLEQLNQESSRIAQQISRLRVAITRVQENTKRLKKAKQQTKELTQEFEHLTDLQNKSRELHSKITPLEDLINLISQQTESINVKRQELKTTETLIHKMLKGRCPVCGNEIKGPAKNDESGK